MSGFEIGLVGFAAMLVLIFIGLPIGIAMAAVGFLGLVALVGIDGALNSLAIVSSGEIANYNLSVIPLFVLMGLFAARSGLSRQLFDAAAGLIGHLRGGLVMATVSACAMFGAICGSSLATAATMTKVAVPEMRARNYADSLSLGSVAAGGTLGILIPPSIMLVIYSLITETPLIDLFASALIPGILQVLMYMVAIGALCHFMPKLGPASPRQSWRAALSALLGATPVIVIFIVVIGGLYLGVFTPTEGAAVGAFATFVYQIAVDGWNSQKTRQVLLETAATVAMVFLIVVGASIFSFFMSLSGVPRIFAGQVQELGLSGLQIAFAIMVLYLLMGCVIDSLGMLLLTVPVLFPLIQGISGDLGMTPEEAALWFGVFAVIAIEIGLITPPIGLNVFVIRAAVKDASLGAAFRGVVPFLLTDILRVVLLILFPVIALWFPRLLSG